MGEGKAGSPGQPASSISALAWLPDILFVPEKKQRTFMPPQIGEAHGRPPSLALAVGQVSGHRGHLLPNVAQPADAWGLGPCGCVYTHRRAMPAWQGRAPALGHQCCGGGEGL